ncbi:MAG: hypothetical protein JWM65_2046 [Sphingomonas bacterium]|nr:hypothetical protein [Sphingomonas bacterium]
MLAMGVAIRAVSRAYMAFSLGSGAGPLKRKTRAMKINVEVDCTPEEARRFMGLPDLTPVHEKYIATLTGAMDGIAPTEAIENMMKSWAPMSEAGFGMWRKMFETPGK